MEISRDTFRTCADVQPEAEAEEEEEDEEGDDDEELAHMTEARRLYCSSVCSMPHAALCAASCMPHVAWRVASCMPLRTLHAVILSRALRTFLHLPTGRLPPSTATHARTLARTHARTTVLLQEQRRAHTIKWAAIYLFAGIAMAAVCARMHVLGARARTSIDACARTQVFSDPMVDSITTFSRSTGLSAVLSV